MDNFIIDNKRIQKINTSGNTRYQAANQNHHLYQTTNQNESRNKNTDEVVNG